MTQFDDKTAERANQPAYFIRVDGLASMQFSTHALLAPTRTTHRCMDIPEGTQQRLTLLQNHATYGEIRVRLADKSGIITDLISSEQTSPPVVTMVNRKVTLYAGYQDIAESEFVPRFVGEVREIELVGAKLYEITFTAQTRRWEDLLMIDTKQAETLKLAAIPAIGQTFIVLASAPTPLLTGQALLYRKDGSQYEKLTVTFVDVPAKRLDLAAGITGMWNDLDNDIFTHAPFVRGNIINVFYALLTGTFERIYEPLTGVAATTDFSLVDFWNIPQGLGIAAGDIDTAGLQFTRDALYANFDVDFLWRDAVKARQFFQAQMFLLGFFPFVTADGKISVRAFVPPGPEVASPVTLLKQDMVKVPKWKRLIDHHFNRVIVRGDVPVASAQGYSDLATREDTGDQTDTDEVGIVEINSAGLRTALSGIALAQEIAARHLRRWVGPPTQTDAETILTKRDLQVGDVIEITDPDLPDTTIGAIGLGARLIEVTRVSVNFMRGVVDVELFDHSFGRKWSWIAPNGTPVYGSASATQKRYAFFGGATNQIGGVDGYYSY